VDLSLKKKKGQFGKSNGGNAKRTLQKEIKGAQPRSEVGWGWTKQKTEGQKPKQKGGKQCLRGEVFFERRGSEKNGGGGLTNQMKKGHRESKKRG